MAFLGKALRGVARRRPAASSLDMGRLLVMPVRWNQQAEAQSHLFDEEDTLRRRLIYRSKQRGWLEMDIMLGNWAAANLKDLDGAQLQQFQEIIDLENPDLFRWLTGQTAVPDEVRANRLHMPFDVFRQRACHRWQIDNAVLHTLIDDLRSTREPKVTVRSATAFEGKVWE